MISRVLEIALKPFALTYRTVSSYLSMASSVLRSEV